MSIDKSVAVKKLIDKDGLFVCTTARTQEPIMLVAYKERRFPDDIDVFEDYLGREYTIGKLHIYINQFLQAKL